MNSYILFIGTDNTFAKIKTADIGIDELTLSQAFKKCRNEKYALIVWEITENNINPKTIIYMFRKLTAIPIIIISNKGNSKDVDEKINLLKAGADLYLENPDESELTAYIESQIRRYMLLNKRMENIPDTISGSSFLILKKERKVFVCGQEVKLTKTEFDIVYYLALHKGQVVTYKELYEKVWHEEYLLDAANIMAHIRRIRLKIGEVSGKLCLISNIRGIGYKFTEEASDEPKIAKSLKQIPNID